MARAQTIVAADGSRGMQGMARVATFSVLAGVLSCQPGKLPCDSNEQWKQVCLSGSSDGGDEGGSGGNAGGTGGNGGTGGGTGGPTASTTIADCDDYATLGAMDMFFGSRCGTSPSCHTGAGAGVWNDLLKPDIWSRLQTTKSKVDCGGTLLIDPVNWQKSLVWVVTRTPTTCPDGSPFNRTMPPQDATPKEPALTDAENACLQSFLKTIAGK